MMPNVPLFIIMIMKVTVGMNCLIDYCIIIRCKSFQMFIFLVFLCFFFKFLLGFRRQQKLI